MTNEGPLHQPTDAELVDIEPIDAELVQDQGEDQDQGEGEAEGSAQPLIRVMKLCGSDVELANFVDGLSHPQGTGRVASRLLLRSIDGFEHTPAEQAKSGGNGSASNDKARKKQTSWHSHHAQDWGRKFLASNGGCAYIDLDHLEIPLPEIRSAKDYVVAWHAMLRIAREAMHRANSQIEPPQRIQVLANNSDGLAHSYGSHLNILITRNAFDNIFHRKMHHLLFLAGYQASSIVFTGQGKVGSENGTPHVDYQLAQRADFFETIAALQTTYHRPIVNTRDEPLCGEARSSYYPERTGNGLARLHVIFYDSNLCHVACYLKIGVLQLITAMIEAGCVDPTMILDDPVDAVVRFSHDPTLQQKVALASGQRLTAVEIQLKFLDHARKFHQQGGFDGIVPEADQILERWGNVLDHLHAGRFEPLVGSLDWLLKKHALQRTLQQHSDLTWQSPQMKHLDHLYSSLDPANGLFWAFDEAGLVEQLVTSGEIEQRVYEPPEDTRAWTRAMLLRLAGPDCVSNVDWDQVKLRFRGADGWYVYRTVPLPDPLGMTKEETSHLFDAGLSLEEVVEELRLLALERPGPLVEVGGGEA